MADMEGDVDRMTHLVEQMLILARVEQGEAVKFEPIALDTLLNGLVQQLQPKAQERQLTLTLEYPPHINLQTSGNAAQLQQVFSNLLDNALKFTPVGGQIWVSLNRNWQQIIATVTDNGPGIPSENLPHLFNRFYRVDSARTRTAGGFGLGLAITHEIVRLHGGTIDVQSQLGQGTTFTVGLPARPGQ